MSTIESELKQLILENYGTISSFAKVANMPYTTIDSIFKRGIMNSSVTNIIKICQVLNITADALADGRIEYVVPINETNQPLTIAAHHDNEEWTEEELEEIERFKEFVRAKRDKN